MRQRDHDSRQRHGACFLVPANARAAVGNGNIYISRRDSTGNIDKTQACRCRNGARRAANIIRR
jgi:hypothetical protein